MQNPYAPQYYPQQQQQQYYQPQSNANMYIGIIFIIIVVWYMMNKKDEDVDEDDSSVFKKSDADLEKKSHALEKEICSLRAEGISQQCNSVIMGKTQYYWNKEVNKTPDTWKAALKLGLHGTLSTTDACGTTDRDSNWGAIYKEPYKSLLEKYAYPPNCRMPS
jgi:hypothetical protein